MGHQEASVLACMIKGLPQEILDQIVDNLDDDLSALKALYVTISERLAKITQTYQSRPMLRAYVQKVTIDLVSAFTSPAQAKHALQDILPLLPLLRHVKSLAVFVTPVTPPELLEVLEANFPNVQKLVLITPESRDRLTHPNTVLRLIRCFPNISVLDLHCSTVPHSMTSLFPSLSQFKDGKDLVNLIALRLCVNGDEAGFLTSLMNSIGWPRLKVIALQMYELPSANELLAHCGTCLQHLILYHPFPLGTTRGLSLAQNPSLHRLDFICVVGTLTFAEPLSCLSAILSTLPNTAVLRELHIHVPTRLFRLPRINNEPLISVVRNLPQPNNTPLSLAFHWNVQARPSDWDEVQKDLHLSQAMLQEELKSVHPAIQLHLSLQNDSKGRSDPFEAFARRDIC